MNIIKYTTSTNSMNLLKQILYYIIIFISLIKLISCAGTPQVENQSLILENKNLKEENRLLKESLESQSKHQEYKVSNSSEKKNSTKKINEAKSSPSAKKTSLSKSNPKPKYNYNPKF
jgi:hypothetical protein